MKTLSFASEIELNFLRFCDERIYVNALIVDI